MLARTRLRAELGPRAPERFYRIPRHLAIFVFLFTAHPLFGQTLRDLLLSYKIPAMPYTERQLAATVQGIGKVESDRTLVVYGELGANEFHSPLQIVEYDSARKVTRTSPIHFKKDDICMGSPEDVYLIDGYSLFSTSLSPSAECLLLLDEKLHMKATFYGFSPVRIALHRLAIIEDMIHFAPVHPERIEVVDLTTSSTTEIYPPANDPLRKQLALEHARKMPSSDVCMRMNDLCKAEFFDEDISPIGTDGHGHLAFLSSQSASHAFGENAEPQTVAEQSVFYSYTFEKGRWYYCEEHIEDALADTLRSAIKDHFQAEAPRHCKPNLQVSPDPSTTAFNPFGKP